MRNVGASRKMLELNRIYCMDCIEGMKQLDDNSVDLVVTDPPYGFNRFPGDEKETFLVLVADAFKEVKRVLKKGSWAFVFSGTGDIKRLLNCIDLNFQRLLWMYKPADCTFPYRGWLLTSEAIALFSNGPPTPLIERKPYHHDCYIHKKVGQEGVEGHPTVKPIFVVRDLVCRVNGLILDPFMGSGTTAVAAKQLNRNFIGFEINEEYCKIAKKRLAQETFTSLGFQD